MTKMVYKYYILLEFWNSVFLYSWVSASLHYTLNS